MRTINIFTFLLFIAQSFNTFAKISGAEILHPVYGAVPSAQQRESNRDTWLSFHDTCIGPNNCIDIKNVKDYLTNFAFSTIHIIQPAKRVTDGSLDFNVFKNLAGIPDSTYYPLVSAQSNLANVNVLRKLQIRDLDLNIKEISTVNSQLNQDQLFIIPFAVSVKFQATGPVARAYKQGTLNVSGNIYLQISPSPTNNIEHGESTDFKVDNVNVFVKLFQDSWWMEHTGRKIHAISEFDGKFVDAVVPTVMNKYFEDKKNVDILIKLKKINIIKQTVYGGGKP